jgi:NAD(P)H-hydrate repair Nnr-like enzyme with NAD(P)H-hydrate dehydratase domain
MYDYWHKQAAEQPLFPDLIWSQPENRTLAGKLGITGGNAQGFAAVAEAYQMAMKAGIGVARVLLPDSLQHSVGRILEAGEYAPSTPNGSFSRLALAEWQDLAVWGDGVLVAGDLGRNSETAILLEQFIGKFQGPLTLTKDAINYFNQTPRLALDRPQTLLVLSFSQLQKLVMHASNPIALTYDMDLLRLVAALHDLTERFPAALVTKHLETYIVAAGGQVSTTKAATERPVWRVAMSATAAVWHLQQPAKTFEALSSAAFSLQ